METEKVIAIIEEEIQVIEEKMVKNADNTNLVAAYGIAMSALGLVSDRIKDEQGRE